MSLLKGRFTFSRFHVEGQLPQAFLNFINNRIKANAYKEAFKATEEKIMGWVALTDILDSDFKNANYALGDYLIFSLRIDRKLIPSKLMRIKIMEEGKRFLSESGKSMINKQASTAIKDKIKMDLLKKTDPVPSFYDVCWAIGKNTVYFSSLSDNVAQDFADLFKQTFSLTLKRFSPQENELITKDPETAENASLISREFLTWLWFKSEERNGRIKIAADEEVELHFLKRIALDAGEGEYAQGVVCHGLHAELKEGKEAIRQGKKVKEAGIKLIHNNNEWEFTLKADSFDFQSLKLPGLEWQDTPENPSGSLLERIYLIENAVKTVDDLFAAFLQIRYSPQWKGKETNLLNKWLNRHTDKKD